MLRGFSSKRIVGFFLIDWLSTLFMLVVAMILRAEIGRLPEPIIQLMRLLQIQEYSFWRNAMPGELLPIPVFFLVSIIWPFFLIVFSVYDGRRNPNLASELINVFLAICISILTLSGVLYFSYRETPRVLIVIFFILDVLLLLGVRLSWGLYRIAQMRDRNQRRQVIVVGAGPVGQNVVQQIKKFAHKDIEFVGYLDDDPQKQGQYFVGIPVLGDLDRTFDIVSKYAVHDAVVALPLQAHKRLVKICRVLQNLSIRVHVIPDLFALSFPNTTLDGFGGIPVIGLGRPGLKSWQRGIKRAFDLIAVAIGIVVLSPLLLLIAILIKLDSEGSILYVQDRVGEFGRPFKMLKFRTMRIDTDPNIHKAHVTKLITQNISLEQLGGNLDSLKLDDDPRITKLGKFLRKTSLDELPQLFNVLLGEMSLVGPRPPLLYEADLYQDWHRRRFEVPPGITGIWQVQGRNRVSFDEMVRMDLEYIDHQSIWLDIKLLLQTPRAVIEAKGAG